MAKNNNVNIKIKSDSTEAESGIKKVTSELNKMQKNIKNSDVAKFSKAFSGVAGSISAAVTTLKKLNEGIKETADLYKVQIEAEKKLETAAKNNPYLNDRAVASLKSYAAELEKVSAVGDEELIPFMAQLAAAGRTQEEIQSIMATALDISASGTMNLDSAVKALNGTFAGTAGTFGKTNLEIKNLTKEELQQGKAVEILSKQYNGMAASVVTADKKLENAKGNFKEAIGQITNASSNTWQDFWAGFYNKGAEVITSLNNYIDDLSRNLAFGGINRSVKEGVKSVMTNYIDASGNEYGGEHYMPTEYLTFLRDELELKKSLNSEEENALIYIKEEIRLREKQQKAQEEARKKEEEALKLKLAEEELEEKASKERAAARKQYNDSLAKMDQEIKARRALGEEISAQEEAQLKYNNAVSAYIALMGTGLFTGNYETEVNARKQIAKWAEDAKEDFKELKEMLDSLGGEDTKKNLIESLRGQIAELDKLAEGLDKNSALYKQYAEARTQLEEALTQAIKDRVSESLTYVKDYMKQIAEITQSITDTIAKSNEAQTQAELTALSEQYTNGIIEYEEFCDKKKEIARKAAQDQYKLDMYNWTASLLTATANIAQGVAKAIADGGVMGLISGALVSAAGAAQIASIIASKPSPPKFANGGYVPGSSYSGDRIPIMANSGELILNNKEQAVIKSLMGANSSGGAGAVVNMPVTIENNTNANIKSQLTASGLRIVVDEMVNSSMQQGRYTDSMNIASNKARGVSLL